MSILSIIVNFGNVLNSSGGSTPPPGGGTGGGSAVNSNVLAFYSAVPFLTNTEKSAIQQLDVQLRSAGIMDRTIAVYPFVGRTSDSCKLNLKNPLNTDKGKRIVFPLGWTFSDKGVKPDGVSAANTFIDLVQDAPSYSFNGTIYSRTNIPPTTDKFLFGSPNVALSFYGTDKIFSLSQGKLITTTGQTQFNGVYSVNSYNLDNLTLLKDGVVIGSNYNTSAVQGGYYDNTSNKTLYLAGRNQNGTPQYFSDYEMGIAYFGWGLLPNQSISLKNIITQFLTTLNRL